MCHFKLLILFLGIFGSLLDSTDSVKCGVPFIPNYYSTNLQVNIDRQPRKSDNANAPPMSKTIEAFEAVDELGKKAIFEMFYEYNNDVMTASYSDKVIFNQNLEGVKNYINIWNFNGLQLCYVDRVHEVSIWNEIFGIDPDHPVFPSISQMLHYGHDYECAGKEQINGIPTDKYTAHVSIANISAELELTYYWSDNMTWTGSAGANRSVPVKAIVTGFYRSPHDHVEHNLDITILFDNFKETRPGDYLFNPPSDMWCEGRQPNKVLPQLPPAYTYNAELIFHWKFLHAEEIDAIVPMTEYYDFKMKASRTDYKPFDFRNITDPFAGTFGFVSAVKDFHSGIVYNTFQDFGNCSANFIGFDISGDVMFLPDGSMHMSTPSHVFHLDSKFVYNGIHYDRGIPMSAYVTPLENVEPLLRAEESNYTIVLEVTSGKFMEEGDTEMESKVPVRFEIYHKYLYNDPHSRVRHNIYALREHRPDYKLFDITACFTGSAVAHKSIRLGWTPEMVIMDDLYEFGHSVRTSLHYAAGITPIRVQNIEVKVVEEESAIYVYFSLVDWPEHLNKTAHPKIPPESTLPLSEAVDNLARNISSNAFEVFVKKFGSDEPIVTRADKDYFKDTDRTIQLGGKRYSPGSMAGLAFGMIALGLALSGGVYFFLLRARVRSQLPNANSGFGNPLHGTANLTP